MVSGSMNLAEKLLLAQIGALRSTACSPGPSSAWNWLPLPPIFVVYLTASLETNPPPFDVVEGAKAEIVAGHMVEYSGMGFAIFFLLIRGNNGSSSILARVDVPGWSGCPV